jgi:hypothetical protein
MLPLPTEPASRRIPQEKQKPNVRYSETRSSQILSSAIRAHCLNVAHIKNPLLAKSWDRRESLRLVNLKSRFGEPRDLRENRSSETKPRGVIFARECWEDNRKRSSSYSISGFRSQFCRPSHFFGKIKLGLLSPDNARWEVEDLSDKPPISYGYLFKTDSCSPTRKNERPRNVGTVRESASVEDGLLIGWRSNCTVERGYGFQKAASALIQSSLT